MENNAFKKKSTKSLLKSELEYERVSNLGRKPQTSHHQKKRSLALKKPDDQNIFEDLLYKMSSPSFTPNKPIFRKLQINTNQSGKGRKLRFTEDTPNEKNFKTEAIKELQQVMKEYVPSRLNTPPSTKRQLQEERVIIEQKKEQIKNTKHQLNQANISLNELLKKNAPQNSSMEDIVSHASDILDKQIQPGDIENLLERYTTLKSEENELNTPTVMKIRQIRGFPDPNQKKQELLSSQDYLLHKQKEKSMVNTRSAFLLKNYSAASSLRPSTAGFSKGLLPTVETDTDTKISAFTLSAPKLQIAKKESRSNSNFVTEGDAPKEVKPFMQKRLQTEEDQSKPLPYLKNEYSASKNKPRVSIEEKDQSSTSKTIKMTSFSMNKNNESEQLIESFRQEEEEKNVEKLSNRMVEYQYFKKEFMPDSLAESNDQGTELPYLFFSSTRIFGLIVQLNHDYNTICTNLSDVQSDYSSAFKAHKKQKSELIDVPKILKKYNMISKQLQAMQNTITKMRKIAKTSIEQTPLRKSLFKENNNSLELVSQISSSRGDIMESEKLLQKLDTRLQEAIDDYQNNAENLIEQRQEIFEGKVTKLQNNTFQNKVLNFLDILNSKYEEMLQDEIKDVFIFYPNLKNYHSKLKKQFKNMKYCLKRVWDDMLGESESFQNDLISISQINLQIIEIFDQLVNLQKTCIYFITKSLDPSNKADNSKLQSSQIAFHLNQSQRSTTSDAGSYSSKIKTFLNLSSKYSDVHIVTYSSLSNSFMEKLTVKVAVLLNSLGSFKSIAKIENEYNPYIEEAEKLFVFAEQRLYKLEKETHHKKNLQNDLKEAIDIETSIIQTLSKISLCENHFSQAIAAFDNSLRSDLIGNTVDILNGFIDKLEINQNKYRKYIDNVCNRLRQEYERLAQEIKKEDTSFNTYVANNIIKKFSFLDFENSGHHLTSISNFAQIMQNHSDKLTESFKAFAMIKDVSLKRSTLLQTKKKDQKDVKFKPSQIGVILHPDYNKIRAIVDNFEKKVRILDEFFLVEDQFCFKNLEQAFRQISFISISSQLSHLYDILSQSFEKQKQLQRVLAKKENEFLTHFIKKVITFEKHIMDFLSKIVSVTSRNKTTYQYLAQQCTEGIPDQVDKVLRSLNKLRAVIESDYSELLQNQLSNYANRNRLYNFFYSILENAANDEQNLLKQIIVETQDAFKVSQHCMTELVNQFRDIKCVLENFEKETAFQDFLDSIEGAMSKKISMITQITENYAKNLSPELMQCLKLTRNYLREQYNEIRKAKGLMDIHLDFTLSLLEEKLQIDKQDDQQSFQILKKFIDGLNYRIDEFKTARYITLTSLVDLSRNETFMDTIHKEFHIFIEYVLKFLSYIYATREQLMSEIESLYQNYIEGTQDFQQLLSKIAVLYEKWVKKTKDFLKEIEHERTPYSCHHIFDKFWNEVIREEALIILRCSKDSQEFEKFIENLKLRFCDAAGEFKETEFLVPNFNEEQAADHEELAFEARKFSQRLKEYLSVGLIASKKIFREELNLRKDELDKFNIFLEILVSVNKEVIIVKERIKLVLQDDSIIEKRVVDAIRVLNEIVHYLQKVYKDIFHSVKRLNNHQVETYVDHHILSALKIALSYFNNIRDYFKTLDHYYDDRREKYHHTIIFMDDNFVKALSEGIAMHEKCNFLYKRRPIRASVQLESLDEVKLDDSTSPINVSRALFRKMTSTGTTSNKEFDFLINSTDMEQQFMKYGMILQDEFSKGRRQFLEHVARAVVIINEHILKAEMQYNGEYFEDDSLAILSKLKNILAGQDLEYDEKADWNEFKQALGETEKIFKLVNWSMGVLKDQENLRKVEIFKFEDFHGLRSRIYKNHEFLQWQKWVQLFNLEIVTQYDYLKNDFQSEQDFMDYLEVKVRIGDETHKFYEENSYLFGCIFRNYFHRDQSAGTKRK